MHQFISRHGTGRPRKPYKSGDCTAANGNCSCYEYTSAAAAQSRGYHHYNNNCC